MENTSSKLFNATVILTVIPAYIYFCTFIYETGICNRLGIPKYLVSPNLTTVLIFATTIWGIIFSSLKVLGFSAPLFRALENKEKTHLHPIFLVNGIYLIVAILMFYAYPFSWSLIWILLGFGVFVNLFWALPYLFMMREKKSAKEKLSEIHNDSDKLDLAAYFSQALNFKERIFLMILVLVPTLSYLFGDGEVLKQKSYLVFIDNPSIAVLRKYDDLLICRTYNKDTKEIGDSLILIKVSDNNKLVLKSEDIGPLKLKK